MEAFEVSMGADCNNEDGGRCQTSGTSQFILGEMLTMSALEQVVFSQHIK